MKVNNISYNNTAFQRRFSFNKPQKKQQQTTPPVDNNDFLIETLKSSIIRDEIVSTKRSKEEMSIFHDMADSFTGEASKIYDMGVDIAIQAHSKRIEGWHLFLASLINFRDYISRYEEGTFDPTAESTYKTIRVIEKNIHDDCNLWANPELVKKVKELTDDTINRLMEEYYKKDRLTHEKPRFFKPALSSEFVQSMKSVFDFSEKQFNESSFEDYLFFNMPAFSQNSKLKNIFLDYILSISVLGKVKQENLQNPIVEDFYASKANSILKNIALGNNALVITNEENFSNFEHLTSSLLSLINNPDVQYDNFDKENIETIILNEYANLDFIESLIYKLSKDNDNENKTIIIIGNLDYLIQLSKNGFSLEIEKILSGKISKNNPNRKTPTIRFILNATPECNNMYLDSPKKELYDIFENYAKQTLPMIDAKDAKKHLTSEKTLKYLKEHLKKDITPEAIIKAIELTSSKIGNYPQKAIALLGAVTKYFVDLDKITAKEVEIYTKETEHLSDVLNDNDSNIIFETGKTLNDIKGMPMTKTSAQTLLNRILQKRIGTQGYIIRHSDNGSYGGGRYHTIEAIAGEAKIPIIKINAKDFAIKDIDALSQRADLSELKIKKIIQTAKAQAETNDLNTAIIYIENFDNFASNPLYGISSIYEQKAFSQLLSEMETIKKEGKLNIIVVGSMNMPETIDENILKPNRFLNQIIIYQPRNKEQIKEILDYYIEKNNYKIAGKTPQEQENIVKNAAKTARGFSVVDLMYMLDIADTISKERNKDAIDEMDFNEAFLQTVSGIANNAKMTETRKKIVASHEAGHAITSYIMNKVIEKEAKPWIKPNDINFITLDPRGDYGGCVYFNISDETQYTPEYILSDLVASYGGHSAENILYKIKGSYGITMDMESAAYSARSAVIDMGMGKKTGVRHIIEDDFLTEKQKENISQDVESMLNIAKEISDSIVLEYQDFIREFSENHCSQVATGDCIISAKQFEEELIDWKNKQTSRKLESLNKLEKDIQRKIKDCQ